MPMHSMDWFQHKKLHAEIAGTNRGLEINPRNCKR
jgi:hypothetical protein